ncbi:unnamed protein product [Adineta steineri]|uniref:Methyltransferase FkbM domain-containing protein n=1 Tax=Adineta steineri TaxID=433720 RepID=A0A815AB15_9BILA|nr:unnamed protein product [Adineta steineri]CAF1542018.1 unnamed protein product [Adineta steineri]
MCVHPKDYVSDNFVAGYNYENKDLHVLLRVLWRYPNMALIDIGANIGSYTMFAAAMGRLVIAIECFEPNYMRVAKAIQIENLRNNVILIGNAVYSKAGQQVSLTKHPGNIGGQGVKGVASKNQSLQDPYVVTTIRLDDILPIIKQTGFRSFAMKIDIEGSEYYAFASGDKLFDSVDVPIVAVEWDKIHLNTEHANYVVQFLLKRSYIPTSDTCKELNMVNMFSGWPPNIFWVKMNRTSIC